MKISQPVKIIIGLLTAWVVLTPILFVGAWFFFVFSLAETQSQSQLNPTILPVFFIPFIFLIILTSLLHVALQAFYLVHIILNRTGEDVVRVLFGVGMIFLAILAMPVYYFVFILPKNPPQWALATKTAQAASSGDGDTHPPSPVE